MAFASTKPAGGGDVSIVPLRLGLSDEVGVILAACQRADFPAETERLLLRVVTNQAAIGLQEAVLLSEQRRVARELDQRVEQRTRELAAANEELRREIAERKIVEEKLRQDDRELRSITDAIPQAITVLDPELLLHRPDCTGRHHAMDDPSRAPHIFTYSRVYSRSNSQKTAHGKASVLE